MGFAMLELGAAIGVVVLVDCAHAEALPMIATLQIVERSQVVVFMSVSMLFEFKPLRRELITTGTTPG
jgi:signal recognition particle receptor subunit beta